ncbi:YraN family protein [uncultured Microbulbifer sp.]|uniref:YraN family protein n=1 Tax=uncultured Microbulbifer sp. TaxID=348147 RepID=UPI0025E6F92A|nr:YraN family protein [uncultured Microbulbifer sp.]
MDTTTVGTQMEVVAAQHLRAAGLKILECNFKSRFGEIDLIARDGETLVFVEVRFRRSNRFGGAGMSVDWRKQRKLHATASNYLQYRRLDCPCRFDVIAIEHAGGAPAGHGETPPLNIEWIKNAFGQ